MSDSAPTTPFWFRIGYALERARQTVTLGPAGTGERTTGRADPSSLSIPAHPRPDRREGRPLATGSPTSQATVPSGLAFRSLPRDPLMEMGTAWLERQVVSRLLGTRAPGRLDLARAALAGAGAELAGVATHAALVGPSDSEGSGPPGAATLLEGAAEGMVYASLFRPILPGPGWVRGAAFGVARYFAARGGGLPRVLGSLSPHRQIPGFDGILSPRAAANDTVAEHIVAGVVLAFLYESSERSRGTTPDPSD